MKIAPFRSPMLYSLALFLLMGFGWHSQASADMVGTADLLASNQVQQQRADVQAFLARDAVRDQLMARGVDADAASERIAALSASELATLHGQIDELPVGEGLLETVLFLLVIFMLLDIAGITDIFPGL